MAVDMLSEKKTARRLDHELAHLLANTYILYLKTQNFHWNVVDPRFHSLHKFFEEQYESLAEAVDEIAERIRAIGGKSPGSMRQFLDLGSLDEAEGNLTGEQMLRQLFADHEALVKEIRHGITKASSLGDEGTADLLIQRIKYHEKTAWMIRSHFLEAK